MGAGSSRPLASFNGNNGYSTANPVYDKEMMSKVMDKLKSSNDPTVIKTVFQRV
jgi:hypothetical protein